MSLVC